MARTYQVFRFWDIQTASEAARISMFDERGDEFWMKVLKPGSGRVWREAKTAALDAIGTAMDQGLEPGEVIVDQRADSVAL